MAQIEKEAKKDQKPTKKLPFDEREALTQIQSEFMQSYAFMGPKKMQWLEYLRAYHDGRAIEDKVKINLAFSNINALQALESMDRLKIQFIGSNFADYAKTKNWNRLAEDDYNKMGMTLMNIEGGYNKYLYGVVVKIIDVDADGDTCAQVFDTRLWFPDPSGCFEAERFRFMGFRKFMTKEEMKDLGFDNLDSFRKLKGQDINEWNPYLGFNQSQELGTNLEMNLYAVYMHMTVIDDTKYIIYTNDEMNTIALVVKCRDLVPEVKKRTLGLKGELRPVELDYWRPQYDNPTGISVMDLTYDKQQALSQLVNLQIKRAIRISLGGHKLYNLNMIKNRNDLAKLDVEPQLIGIDMPAGGNLAGAMYEQPVSAQMPQDNFSAQDTLQFQTKLGLGFDSNQLGLGSQGSQTATETNVIQANSNVIQGFGTVLNIEHEKRRWFKWHLVKKKARKGKKTITILNSLGEKALEFGEDDLMIGDIENILIKSTNEVNAKNAQELQQMQMMIPFMQQMGGYAYRKFIRDLVERITGDEEKALEYVYYSSDELEAMKGVMLLNNDEELSPVTDIMNEDHIAYIMWYQQAKDSSKKQVAIANRMEAQRQKEISMKQSNQDLQNTQQGGGGMANQMAGAMIQQGMQNGSAAGKPIATNAG